MPKLTTDKYLVGFKLQKAMQLTKLHKHKEALSFHCSKVRVMFICCCCCFFFLLNYIEKERTHHYTSVQPLGVSFLLSPCAPEESNSSLHIGSK